MATVAELRAEFSKLHGEAKKVIDDAIAADKELTPELKTENDKRFARMEQIKKLLDDQGKFAALALGQEIGTGTPAGTPGAGTVTGPATPPGKEEIEKALQFATQQAGKLNREEFGKAVGRWANSGTMDAKFATITTATQNSIFLPVEVSQPLIPVAPNTFRLAFSIWGLPVMSTATTAQFNVPVLSASSGGAVAENSTTETENEPGLSESIVSKPGTYHSGESWFSNNQLAATDFDLVSAFTPAWLASKELGLEAVIAAAIIADAGITNIVTTAGTAAITVADLNNLDQALPKKFQMYKVIVLSQTAYAAACGLTFASGGFVLSTDANGLRRFNGTPVLRCDNFQALGATNIIGCCMSLAGFHLRDAGQVKIIRYTQVPTKPDQSGFDLVSYNAYGYADSAMALFKNHA